VHFGEVPLAEVFDLRGFNLNAKLDIDPEFLSADDHDHDHDHDHAGHDHTAPTTTPPRKCISMSYQENRQYR
jgi:G3E family GTPase